MADTKLDRLKANLMTSGLQQKDNALFQVINQLIDYLRQLIITTSGAFGSGGSGGFLLNATYLTVNNESGIFPNSRRLLAGIGISFDDTIANERTINVSSGIASVGYWTVLTDGNVDETDLIFANGEAIAVFVPTP